VPEQIGPFGELLSPAERAEFVSRSRLMRYQRGGQIFLEGEPTRHAALIESGSVKIVRQRHGGGDLILAVRGPNDLIGEMAAIDGTPRSAGAIAMGEVSAYLMEAVDFEQFVRANSQVAWMLIRSMAERQRDADDRRVNQASTSVPYRVAGELLDMAAREVGLADNPGEGLVVSQVELAEVVGATREAVAKALGDLRRAGAIETARRRLRIVDRAKLIESMRD
jgi:CRP/FNR family transcriptional regulator, cyclic AMP receptor protein